MPVSTKYLVPRINVFISSSSDVKEERDAAEMVIKRLANHPLITPYFDLRALRWETSVPSAAMNPQDAVNYYIGQASDAHIVLCIFANRIGTSYTHPQTGEQFDGGTQYEFIDAYRSNQKNGSPHVMVYRGNRYTGDQGSDQKTRLDAFFARIGTEFHVLYANYDEVDQFAEKFERDLLIVLGQWISDKRFNNTEVILRSKDEIVHDSSRINFDVMLPIFGRKDVLHKIEALYEKDVVGISLIGLGGVGKSRVAAEVARSKRFKDGVVWHEITPNSTVEDLTNLIADRIGADRDMSSDDIWALLSKLDVLLVLDNAEDCTNPTIRANYVKRLKSLRLQGGTRALMTSRERWPELQGNPTFKTEELIAPDLDSALQILSAMYVREQPAFSLDNQQEAFVRAAQFHPRIIEQSVCWLWNYPVSEVIERLRTLRGEDAKGLLDDIVQRTVELVSRQPNGEMAVAALSKLVVFKGGFTADAANAVAGSTDSLGILRRYCLLGISNNRYDIHSIVQAVVSPDRSIGTLHYSFFKQLVEQCTERQEYAELNVEALNIDAAFDYLIELGNLEEAFVYYDLTTSYFYNRGQYGRWLQWITTLVNEASKSANTLPASLMAKVYLAHASALNGIPSVSMEKRNIDALKAVKEAEKYANYSTEPEITFNILNDRIEIEKYFASKISESERKRTKYQELLSEFQRWLALPRPVLQIHELADFLRSIAWSYRIMADLYRRLEEVEQAVLAREKALHIYDEVQELYISNGDNRGLAATKTRYAIVCGGIATDSRDLTEIIYYRKLAIRMYAAAVDLTKGTLRVLTHGMHLSNLAFAYKYISNYEERRGNLKNSISTRLESLRFRTASLSPSANVHSVVYLAVAYRELSEIEEFQQNLELAIEQCQRALTIVDPLIRPDNYSSLWSQLAKTFLMKSTKSLDIADLKKAEEALIETIKYRTSDPSDDHYGYFSAYGYLHYQYGVLNTGDRNSHFDVADDYFNRALRTNDEASEPIDRSGILVRLANLYRTIGVSRSQSEYLDKALEIAKNALLIRQERYYFSLIAEALEVIGLIYRDMERIQDATDTLREASAKYRQMDMEYNAERCATLANHLSAAER